MIESTTRTLTDWKDEKAVPSPPRTIPRYKMMLKNITPRLYQETMISTCVDKNCLVVLPTGLGKTVIALMLASQRLSCFPNSKILFLAPTKPLVEQHLETFKKHFELEEGELAVFTGHVAPAKRAALWKEAKIVFSTPQGLENDIISNRIDVADVSLMIFDEAHRATGDYAYTFVAKQYDRKARFPRILALTASPGSEAEKINEVCQNLFIEGVELRTDDDPDVKPYIQDMNIRWVTVEFPEAFKKTHKYLKDCYESKLAEVKNLGYLKKDQMYTGKTQILKLQGFLHGEIARGDKSFELLKSVSLLAEAMKVEHGVELIETQGVGALLSYCEKIYSDSQTSTVKAVKNLACDLNFKSAFILAKRMVEEGVEHPKMAALRSLVEKEIRVKPDVKIIIFNQFRDSAKKIHDMMSSLGIEGKMFFGQAKKNGTGLSQKEQKQVLDEFKRGEFNCLVATSVAEEGIDIPCVDLVVFYEPVPSGIRTIQRRGRTGRQDAGRVVAFMTKGTREEAYKWSAHHKEKRMYRELEKLRTKFNGFTRKQDSNLDKFIAPEMPLTVFADCREKASGVIKHLVDMGISMNLKTLDVGDYMLSDRVCVEYKKVPDFVDSIVDGRLLEQIKNLRHSFDRPMVIVEGDEDLYSQRNVHPNAIRGMLSTIMVSYGIPVVQTKTASETASLMAVIAKREQDPEQKTFSPHGSRKPMTLHEQQEYIVSALPGVGPLLSKPLLEMFGSVKEVLNASCEELKLVDKIGEKKAREIQRVLTEKYEKK
ncbi:DEAD/DEAH box helicase [Nanoarchaeota archaeon]